MSNGAAERTNRQVTPILWDYFQGLCTDTTCVEAITQACPLGSLERMLAYTIKLSVIYC